MVCLLKILIELGVFVSISSTVWENTDGCEKQYRCDIDIFNNCIYHIYMGSSCDKKIVVLQLLGPSCS